MHRRIAKEDPGTANILVGHTGLRFEYGAAQRDLRIVLENVQERLEVLYGNQARFEVVSNPGRGTLVSIEIPANLPFEP